MNAQNAKDYLPLVQALTEGKTIQWDRSFNEPNKWVDMINIDFSESIEHYRIKPDPRRWWLTRHRSTEIGWQIWGMIPGVSTAEYDIVEVVEVVK